MTAPRLNRLKVANLTSLRAIDLELTTDVTVLIGANGSGKSNLVSALELLSRILERQLQETVLQTGGFAQLLHSTASPAEAPEEASLEVWGEPDSEGISNGYRAVLSPAADDEVMLNETLFIHARNQYPRPYSEVLGAARESRLLRQTDTRVRRFVEYVQPLLDGIRVYHFDDVSPGAPAKRLRPLADNLNLHQDAGNLAPYLFRLSAEHPDVYARITTVIRNVAPYFDDFVLVPEGSEHIRLRWRQKGLRDVTFGAGRLSDGTLRFICLTTLLLSPDAPRVVVLDEPELGLHPFAIAQLAALIGQATRGGRQAIIATQSTLLLDQFPLESVVLLDRREGATTLSRPRPDELGSFLEDYSLSELWQMNLLAGGRPAWGEGRA